MVTATTENVRRSEELLPKHQSGDLVRQRHGAHGQFCRCPRRKLTVDPEITADDEIKTRFRPVLTVAEESSEPLTRQSLTGLIEYDQCPSRFEPTVEHPRFLTQNLARVVGAAAGHRFQDSIFRRPTLLDPPTIDLHLFIETTGATTAEP